MRFWIIAFVLAMVGLATLEAEVTMTPVETFRGKRVALFGLGGSGLSTVRALAAGGAEVALWDDDAKARDRAAAAGFAPVDLAAADWRDFAALVLAPGVPLTHPKPHWTVDKAKAAGLDVIGDIELFAARTRRSRAGRAVRRHHRHQRQIDHHGADRPYPPARRGATSRWAAISACRCSTCRRRRRSRVHVVECSSFQIDLAPSLRPSVGALINLTPDHLDRHGAMENYAAIKERLVAHSDVALVGVDDDYCRAIAERLRRAGRRVVTIAAAAVAARRRLGRGSLRRRARRAGARSICARRRRCAATTTARTPPSPSPRRARSASAALRSRAAWRASPASPIAWSRSAGSAACCSSTTPRRPTPTRRRKRC